MALVSSGSSCRAQLMIELRAYLRAAEKFAAIRDGSRRPDPAELALAEAALRAAQSTYWEAKNEEAVPPAG